MNYLLFQPEILTNKDRVYKNGQLLNETKDYSATYDMMVSLFENAGNASCPWMGRHSGLYVLRGFFNTKDEKGRMLSFLYASNGKDVKDELKKLSCQIGYEVAGSTYQTVDRYMELAKKKRLTSIFAIISIVVIISLTIILCNH